MLVSGLFKNAILMSGSPLAHWAMAMPNQYPGSNINSTILRIALNAADIRQISVQDLIAIESIMSKVIANFPFSFLYSESYYDSFFKIKAIYHAFVYLSIDLGRSVVCKRKSNFIVLGKFQKRLSNNYLFKVFFYCV